MIHEGKLEFIGSSSDCKEYYLDFRKEVDNDDGDKIPNPDFGEVVWRIPDIREAVVSEPGYLILSADYSQIEVKLMAHLSRDPVLIAAINSGKDVHTYNATEVFGAKRNFDYDLLNKARKDKSHLRHVELTKLRNDIKTVTFGVPYGAGRKKVALMTGMTEDAAQEFIDEFFYKFKVLKLWLQRSGIFAIENGYSLSPRGRRRFYDLPSSNASDKDKDKVWSQIKRYAGNHPIQAGNVDMLKPAMYEIYNDLRKSGLAFKGARILFCVHDEIVITCREEDQEAVKAIMIKRMQESYDNIIPDIVNKIDVSVATLWEKA